MLRPFFALFLFLSSLVCVWGNPNADSLERALPGIKKPAEKLNAYLLLARELQRANPDKSLFFSGQALRLAQEQKNDSLITMALRLTGNANWYLSNFDVSLKSYLQAYQLAEKRGDIPNLTALTNNIGSLYKSQNDPSKALEYYQKAYSIAQKSANKEGIGVLLGNIGSAYLGKKDFDSALVFYHQAVGYYKTYKDPHGESLANYGMGDTQGQMGRYDSANFYLEKALAISLDSKDIYYAGVCYNLLGGIAVQQGKYSKARDFYEKGIAVGKEIKSKTRFRDAYLGLAQLYEKSGDYTSAYRYLWAYSQMKDSIFNDEKNNNMARLQNAHDMTQKQNEINLLNNEQKRQQQLVYFMSICLLLVLLAIGALYKAFAGKKKSNLALKEISQAISAQNEVLELQKGELEVQKAEMAGQAEVLQKAFTEISSQNRLIEEKSKNITASIRYAQRIQEAVLPKTEHIQSFFNGCFVFYKPRDIVSGDFYWFRQLEDGSAILAVADCTGHGVPGALMSIKCDGLLNQAVDVRKITRPDLILNDLHANIRKTLKQDESSNRDGMDIAILRFDKKDHKGQFAGAKGSMVYFQNGTMNHLKGDKNPIGGHQYEADRAFSLHEVLFEKNSKAYFFTDGYQDQTGGDSSYKLMRKGFFEYLVAMQQLDMAGQKDFLAYKLKKWQKNEKQIDDILVMGVIL